MRSLDVLQTAADPDVKPPAETAVPFAVSGQAGASAAPCSSRLRRLAGEDSGVLRRRNGGVTDHFVDLEVAGGAWADFMRWLDRFG
jgi:hypothetical protein